MVCDAAGQLTGSINRLGNRTTLGYVTAQGIVSGQV
ncbi:MAG: hypothetical protein KF708_19990 [Pirellulales bacterium]|nr:hypothetical protein [Pirellulales bacterium]